MEELPPWEADDTEPPGVPAAPRDAADAAVGIFDLVDSAAESLYEESFYEEDARLRSFDDPDAEGAEAA
jgi:hypothetical protein